MNTYYLIKPEHVNYRLSVMYRDDYVTKVKEIENKGIMPDFMMKPFPLLSNRMKTLFEKFIEQDLYKPCIVDEKPELLFWEFLPLKIKADCARFTPGGDVCAVQDFGIQPFLAVEGTKKTSFLISEIVAESLLRRGFTVLTLTKIETISKEERN